MIGRVTLWENAEVHGQAFSSDRLFEANMAKVNSLRKRQADYLASLPTEPKDAIRAARHLLHPGGDSYPEGFEEGLRLSHALPPMIEKLETDTGGAEREAVIWVATRVIAALEAAADRLDRISDILDRPIRMEHEAALSDNMG